ncbi:hypothetical protein [Methylocystis sp. B8]|uniref:hypothetical protein n=1 Tax=Methylocystis sp. B8 TaxID=544938 RepID=UPI0014852A24|nr:hypothetical protein [Methylocystis sp. B8]
MSKLHQSVIDAASLFDHIRYRGVEGEQRARRVMLALAAHPPEEATKNALKTYQEIGPAEHEKALLAAVVAFLETVGGGH